MSDEIKRPEKTGMEDVGCETESVPFKGSDNLADIAAPDTADDFIHADSICADSSVSGPGAADSPLSNFLTRLSRPLFLAFFSWICLMFAGYAGYFIYALFSPEMSPGASFSLSGALSAVFGFFSAIHLQIAVGLAFLNFIVSFVLFLLSGKPSGGLLKSFFASVKRNKGNVTFFFIATFFVTGLFSVSAVFGWTMSTLAPDVLDSFPLFGDIADDSSFQLFQRIFFNNARVVFLSIFLGFAFGLFSIFTAFGNGLVIGLVSHYAVQKNSAGFFILGVAPHGIIELPVILAGAGLGLFMGVRTTKFLLGFLSFDRFEKSFISLTWIFFLIAVPLLFTAAVIEVYVTLPLLGIFF